MGEKKVLRLTGLLEERVERRGSEGVDEGVNPYWAAEETPPHPAPEQGCIRRGLCCKSSPGWFGPGEVEAAAALLGMEPGAFVARFVVIDAIAVDGRSVEVFVPVKRGRDGEPLSPPGTRVDRLYRQFRSPCIFYGETPADPPLAGAKPAPGADGAGCLIYAARPAECRAYLCTQPAELNLSHATIARRWLGEEP